MNNTDQIADYRRSPEWRSWCHLRNRCNNPRNGSYHNYGGRGIKVCKRWDLFGNFLEDVGRRPSPNHTIHRINNDGDYEPGNVKWADLTEQHNNTRANRLITVNGERLTVADASRKYGVNRLTLGYRLYVGWGEQRAATQPVAYRGQDKRCKK